MGRNRFGGLLGKVALGVMVVAVAAVVLAWGAVNREETTNIPTTSDDTPICTDREALKYLQVQEECHRLESER